MRIVVPMVFVGLCTGGCSASQASLDMSSSPTWTTTKEGLLVTQSDIDDDGMADVWSYFRVTSRGKGQRILVRKTHDLNVDGRPDVIQEFDAKERLLREHFDMNFDGRKDVVREYQDGRVVREELSSRFDGRFNVYKYYENGVLVLKTVDTEGNGTPDEFYYFVNNQLKRVGRDRDGDGRPEVFEDHPTP